MVMEKAPLVPEESKSSPESTPTKKRRSVREVVRDWLYYREFGSTPVEETESDSDIDTEKKKKKNRFQKFFKRMFSNEVVSEPVTVTPANELVAEVPLLSRFVDYKPTSEAKPLEESVDVLSPVVSAPGAPEIVPVNEVESVIPELPTQHPINEVTVALHPREEQFSAEQTTTPLSQEVKRESFNEYGSRNTLKGVDNLSRRRDKIQQKEIDHTKKELKKVQELQEQTAQELMEETDRVRHALSEKRIERPQEATFERPRVEQQLAPQSVKEILAKRRVESVPAPAEKRTEAPAQTNYEQPKPEVVQKVATEVSEQSIAFEGLLDRRHEVKDEANFLAHQYGGQSGNTTVSSQQTMVSVNPTDHSQNQINKKVPNIKTLDAQYKKAALNGVWAAVILLVFLAILFFVR